MRHIAKMSEHEMVAIYLKTEIESLRWGADILRLLGRDGIARQVVDYPDITNTIENEYRQRLIGEFRGYRWNEGLFEGFPGNIGWERAALTQDELFQIKYINYSYWNELSSGTRLAVDAARAIQAGEIVFNVPNDGFLALVNALRCGATFPELIVVRTGKDSHLIVLEGHLRLTAYALVPEILPGELEVVLGTSPELIHWDHY